MKQYCRYCAHIVTGNGTWCSKKEKELAESTAKSVNHCKEFEFCEIDAFFETDGYKPRERKLSENEKISAGQMEMELIE